MIRKVVTETSMTQEKLSTVQPTHATVECYRYAILQNLCKLQGIGLDEMGFLFSSDQRVFQPKRHSKPPM